MNVIFNKMLNVANSIIYFLENMQTFEPKTWLKLSTLALITEKQILALSHN